jgi:predicted Zn-dependent peptidase
MVFKGTSKIGAKDYAKEKILLDSIERMFNRYRKLKDENQRKALYKKIDAVSLEASKLCYANEYDKLLSHLGGQGTNAFTSVEQTVYMNTIPSNQLEKWLETERERFSELVPRLFHTELEAVYEEKNMSLDDDNDKMSEALLSGLFRKHQYGTQTTIGTVEHLKNPSITEIKKFFNRYYVPNNMAICLAGA